MAKTVWSISLQLTDKYDPAPFTKRQIRDIVRGIQRNESGVKVSEVKIEKVSK